MAKIEFIDPLTGEKASPKAKARYWGVAVAAMLVCLIIGAIGGVGGVLLFSADNGALAKRLGLPNLGEISIPTTRTEKVVVEESNAIIDASQKVAPAVVSIQLKTTVSNIFGQVFESEGAGTGFIITNDGLILTNKHVVSDANAKYTVVLTDGRSYDASVKSVDPYQDIAVLEINERGLPVVELGDSDQLKIGQWVVAHLKSAATMAVGCAEITLAVNLSLRARINQPDVKDSPNKSPDFIKM